MHSLSCRPDSGVLQTTSLSLSLFLKENMEVKKDKAGPGSSPHQQWQEDPYFQIPGDLHFWNFSCSPHTTVVLYRWVCKKHRLKHSWKPTMIKKHTCTVLSTSTNYTGMERMSFMQILERWNSFPPMMCWGGITQLNNFQLKNIIFSLCNCVIICSLLPLKHLHCSPDGIEVWFLGSLSAPSHSELREAVSSADSELQMSTFLYENVFSDYKMWLKATEVNYFKKCQHHLPEFWVWSCWISFSFSSRL